MANMITLATTAVPDHVRGALSRWLIEVAPGLYIGTVSARVRDELWSTITAVIGDGAAILAHPDNTEQGFTLKTAGTRRRVPTDFDGLTLVTMQASTTTEPAPIWPEDW